MSSKKSEVYAAFKAAFPYTIPVLTGFLVLGMAYGVLMKTSGFETKWAVAMSLIAFCGSMQFAAINLLLSAFNPIQALVLSIMVNARHIFYGISMLEKYKGLGKTRNFLIYTLCDETFSIVSGVTVPKDINKKYFYFAISFLDYIYWTMGTLLGCVLGGFITFSTEGLDFALTALFVVLFIEQTKKGKVSKISGAIGIISALIALLIFGADNVVIPAMIIILVLLLSGRKKLC